MRTESPKLSSLSQIILIYTPVSRYEATTLQEVAVSAYWTRGGDIYWTWHVAYPLSYFLEDDTAWTRVSHIYTSVSPACPVYTLRISLSLSSPLFFLLMYICVSVHASTCIYSMYISSSLHVYILYICVCVCISWYIYQYTIMYISYISKKNMYTSMYVNCYCILIWYI